MRGYESFRQALRTLALLMAIAILISESQIKGDDPPPKKPTATSRAKKPKSAAELRNRNAAAVTVGPPPAAWQLPPFFKKYIDAGGIPILGSGRIPDAALLRSQETVKMLLSARADIRQAMIQNQATLVVIAPEEQITDVPGMEDLPQMFPNQDWTKRRAGGGTLQHPHELDLCGEPVASAGEQT